jgi:hypothetical protein
MSNSEKQLQALLQEFRNYANASQISDCLTELSSDYVANNEGVDSHHMASVVGMSSKLSSFFFRLEAIVGKEVSYG